MIQHFVVKGKDAKVVFTIVTGNMHHTCLAMSAILI